jgi:hypothetical protein
VASATGEPASVVARPVHPDEANIAGQASRHTPRISQKATYPRSLPCSTKTVIDLGPFATGTSFSAFHERPTRIGHAFERCADSTASLQPKEEDSLVEYRFCTRTATHPRKAQGERRQRFSRSSNLGGPLTPARQTEHQVAELACSTWIDNALMEQPKTRQFGPKRGGVCK